ncbi:sel1 repeat family protein [Aliivibrio finisterrensis]|uniref:tetratricopeptide repeat protein n=1 Tax=Aliivibrio finisterrensis TaxID=511998 RepID=UPI001021990D|nr:tetratricopeptide repeat protein [Aliivibrio finisterrensis]RYU67017.1 sel1 repeat family protein [Aliivibrio finisterrensis]RYU70243.1 sel1 repeat family protein [Aliivibrio finisterrensis]RYU72381.1 sel1 repeat family protein [Aliivibrio finisterrensis]
MKLILKSLLLSASLCSSLALANTEAHQDYLKGTAYLNQDNYKDAITWLTSAANNGSIEAQNKIGVMYAKGIGTDVNTHLAIQYFTKAAKNESSMAYYNLGKVYESQNKFTTATNWYNKAIEMSNSNAMNNLADLYLQGKGLVQNTNQAELLYVQAAELGNATSMRNLGFLYFKGIEVKQDMEKAYFWFNLAAAKAYPEADTYRDFTGEKLYKTQRISVQNDALEWLEEHSK